VEGTVTNEAGARALIERDDLPVTIAIAPDEAERERLQRDFLLDDYDLASTLDPDEVPRLEIHQDRMLLIVKIPERARAAEAVELGVNVVGLVLRSDRLAFVSAGGSPAFSEREYRGVRDTRDLMLAFLLRTVRHFVGHLKVIRQVSSDVEKKITTSMENRHLLQMFALSESLVYYLDALEGNAAVLEKLRAVAPQWGFSPHQVALLDDIVLENAQAGRHATIFSNVLSGLMDARGNIVNNNMNVLLKNLTLINIVFLPLNLIASIGGMSEWSAVTEGMDWRLSYGLFCLGIVLLGLLTWVGMKLLLDRAPRQRRR
jgi:magnesium transporter